MPPSATLLEPVPAAGVWTQVEKGPSLLHAGHAWLELGKSAKIIIVFSYQVSMAYPIYPCLIYAIW